MNLLNYCKIRGFSFLLALATLVFLSCEKKEVKRVYPELMIPKFTMYQAKDSAVFSNQDIPDKGLLLIKYFSPDCNHCQNEAALLSSKKDSLQNFNILWLTGSWAALDSIQQFRERYQVDQLNTLAIGKEDNDFFLRSFQLSTVPFSVVYKDQQLVKEYGDELDLKELFAMNNGTYMAEPIDSVLARVRALRSR